MTKTESAAILAQLYTAWPKEVDPDQIEREVILWHWAFQHEPYEDVLAGIMYWVKGGKPFMPKPSDIRRMIAERLICTHIPEEAYQLAADALLRHGPHLNQPYTYIGPDDKLCEAQPPELPPIILRTIKAVTPQVMREAPTHEARKQFIFTMRSIMEQEVDRLVYGNEPLALPAATLAELPTGT